MLTILLWLLGWDSLVIRFAACDHQVREIDGTAAVKWTCRGGLQ
jgi:hypothetical protein